MENREPLLDLLDAPHRVDLLDGWQRLARAAALGEHDFTAGVSYGQLTPAQNRRVVKDAADLTRALVLIDDRYRHVPGWQHLKGVTGLGRAAEHVSQILEHQNLAAVSTPAVGDPLRASFTGAHLRASPEWSRRSTTCSSSSNTRPTS